VNCKFLKKEFWSIAVNEMENMNVVCALLACVQTWFQNHRSRAKQSLRRLANADAVDATTTTTTTTTAATTTASTEEVVVKTPVRCCRKRSSADVDVVSDQSTRTAKRRHVSLPSECDQTSADLTNHLTSCRRTFSQLQVSVFFLHVLTKLVHDADSSQSSRIITLK